jgi:hypothetical protein
LSFRAIFCFINPILPPPKKQTKNYGEDKCSACNSHGGISGSHLEIISINYLMHSGNYMYHRL